MIAQISLLVASSLFLFVLGEKVCYEIGEEARGLPCCNKESPRKVPGKEGLFCGGVSVSVTKTTDERGFTAVSSSAGASSEGGDGVSVSASGGTSSSGDADWMKFASFAARDARQYRANA